MSTQDHTIGPARPPAVHIHTTPPAYLAETLASPRHMPYSLPLLRRLQFAARFPGGITRHARILYVPAQIPSWVEVNELETPFAAGYLDLSRGPETELWMYSSLEGGGGTNTHGTSSPDAALAVAAASADAALRLLREVKRLRDVYDAEGPDEDEAEEDEDRRSFPREHPSNILIGSLGEPLRRELVNRGRCSLPYCEVNDKWVFRLDGLPAADTEFDEGATGELAVEGKDGSSLRLRWAELTRDQLPYVLSRNKIPRKVRTLKLLPNKAIVLPDGTPIAWCFLGPDSSLTSLHCEPEYRGRGLAKAVAVRVLRDHLGDYADDEYCFADVGPNNPQSQGVCRSLGGSIAWTNSWSRIDLDRSFADM